MIKENLEIPAKQIEKISSDSRDLRIDFIRGVVMFILIIVHVEFFSLYNFVAWERFGLVSGGEGFVILAGFVIGMVYKKKIIKSGWKESTLKLIDRAFQLYKVNLFIIFSIWLISNTGIFDTTAVTTFHDRVANKFYNLYTAKEAGFQTFIYQAMTLKIGPHQTQILGLYTFLIAISPIALFLLVNKRTNILLTLSWIAYLANAVNPYSVTGAQFENAFPLLTWQLIYFHGMAFGFYKKEISDFMANKYKKYLMVLAYLAFLVFLFIAQNNPNPTMPSYAKISLISPETFNYLYITYFQKNTLGLLRLVNYFVVLVVGFELLTKYWSFFNKYFGWFFIPIGQATLYVFIVHVYAVMLISNFIPFNFHHEHLIANTIGHSVVLFGLWLMVKNKMLYPWIPR